MSMSFVSSSDRSSVGPLSPKTAFRRCKNSLRSAKDFVDEARQLARKMVQRECRGPGDMIPAMQRIETTYGVPYGVLWSLRYRPPKTVASDLTERLRAVYATMCERQAAALDLEATRAKATLGDALDPTVMGKVDDLLREVAQLIATAKARP